MATPKLRFKEFDGDWELTTLGRTVRIKSGYSPSRYELRDIGEIPFLKVEELNNCSKYQEKSRFYTDKNNDVVPSKSTIFPKRGAAILNNKVRILNNLALLDSNLMALIPESDLHAEYLYYLIGKIELYKIADTSTIPQINNKHIDPYEIILPNKKEQTKIATFLSAVDTKIDELIQKHELLTDYKKGMMQQIFSQKLRFKADDGSDFEDWTQCTLSAIATRVTRKNKEGNQNPLTISAQMGLVNQQKYFNKQVASKNLSNYYLLYKGEYAYNKSYSAGYPMGVIKRLKNYDKGAVSTLYICFSLNNKINTDFFEHYVESGNLIQELEKIAQEGARNHGLLNVGIKEFFEINLSTPCLKEQTKIANFLTAIDQKIDNVAEQIDHAKTWKKGLLQQMFV